MRPAVHRSVRQYEDAAGELTDAHGSTVLVDAEVRSRIVDEADGYDTVAAGVSEKSAVSTILDGSIAEQIERRVGDNVVMIRGPYETRRSVRVAIAQRLAD